MKTVTRGVIHGKTIELSAQTGLPDGQEVTVTLEASGVSTATAGTTTAGVGIRESAGGWAEDSAELDKYLEWNRQQRKATRPSIDA